MDAFLILLFGLLAVLAIPGLVFLFADQVGPTETHHIGRHDFDHHDIDYADAATSRTEMRP